MMNWCIEGYQVRGAHGGKIDLEYPVKQAAVSGGVLVVVLDVPASVVMPENVFGLSSECKQLWQIERNPAPGNATTTDVYTSILANDGEAVSLYNWGGYTVSVDSQTGRLRGTTVSK